LNALLKQWTRWIYDLRVWKNGWRNWRRENE
jgi:hypothetical protein